MSTRKRILYGTTVLLVWLGFVTNGAYALFSDSAALTGNTIASGTASLLISNSQNPTSTIYEEARPGFAFTMSPGEYDEKYLILKNASQSNVDFDISVSAVLNNTVDTYDLPQSTTIEFTPVDELGTVIGESKSTLLGSLLTGPLPLNITVPKGSTMRLKMRTGILAAYTPQGVSVTYDLIFTGNQKISMM